MSNEAKTTVTIDALQQALPECWSLGSSSRWRADNPALGQCGVTSLVAHDLLGGEILKTPLDGMWHFYNRIDGQRIDFTESQFETPIDYADMASDRLEAFGDTNADQFKSLGGAVSRALDIEMDLKAFDD